MTRDSLLRWVERGLLGVGIGLAAWCAVVLVEARFHSQLPIPAGNAPLKVTQTLILPGEGGGAAPRPAPSAGTLIGRLEAPTVKMSATVLEGSDDHVALNGVDRWIGGVHLTGRTMPWRWDEGTESITGPRSR